MTQPLDVVLAGVHRGGSRIIDLLADETLAAINWTLVDPKVGRSEEGAVRLRRRTATATVIARTADAVAVVRERARAANVLVAAVDTGEALAQLVAARPGTPVLWQLVGRMPLSSGGTCFGLAGSIAPSDPEGQRATLALLATLNRMTVPAASAYLTDSNVLTGPLLCTFREAVAARTADRLARLAAGTPAVTTVFLVLPNDALPVEIMEGRADEHVAVTVQRVLAAHGRPRAGRCGAFVLSPDRIDLLRIDTSTGTLIGLITLEPPASPRDAALLTD